MSTEHSRSLDGFVSTIERRARMARTISVSITIGTLVLGGLTLFFTIGEIRKRIRLEEANLKSVTEKRIQAEEDLARLQKEYELKVQESTISRTALNELPTNQRESLLQKAEVINRTSTPDSPMVFLQILDNKQRDGANGVSAMLKKNGFKVQGVELVRVPVSLKQTEVKYFRPEYADEAQKIVSLLKQQGIQATTIALKAAAGQIEVWFSLDAFPADTNPSLSGSSESASLAKAADGTMFDLLESLQRPADEAEATKKLQRIIAALERDKEAAAYLTTYKISSHDKTGLRLGLENVRRAVKNDKKFRLLNRINRAIVDFGK